MTALLHEPLRNFGDETLVRSLNRFLRGFGFSTSVLIETYSQVQWRDVSDGWFWAEAWQSGEREVDALVSRGEVSVFDDIDKFLAHVDEVARPE